MEMNPCTGPRSGEEVTDKNRKERRRRVGIKKEGYDRVVFVPPTSKTKFKKSFEEEIKKTDFKTKVAGTPIKRLLQELQPFPNKKCKSEEQFMICSNGDRGMCRNECVTYNIECSNCDSVYIGESARNANSRGAEHTTAHITKTKTLGQTQ